MICQGCCDNLFVLNRKQGLTMFLAPRAVVTARPVQPRGTTGANIIRSALPCGWREAACVAA